MADVISVRTTENPWDWWYEVGRTYTVKLSSYRATSGATLNYCFCGECCKERAGKTLYEVYEVFVDGRRGGIIPVCFTERMPVDTSSAVTSGEESDG